jgi:hypothetical protein
MPNYRQLAGVRKRTAPKSVVEISNFLFGLNSSEHPSHLLPGEMAEAINVMITEQGRLRTREPLQRYTNSAIPAKVIAHEACVIGDQIYELVGGNNNKIYYLDANRDPVEIGGDTDGDMIISPYNGVAIILDGGYIKYIDSDLVLKIAYDDGTGPGGYQFNDTSLNDNNGIALHSASNVRAATKFMTEDWGAFQIPPTYAIVMLSKSGTPTGSISFSVRKVSDDSVIAQGQIIDASQLPNEASLFEVQLTSTENMLPATEYYFSVEYDGGDASNYVDIRCNDDAVVRTAWTYDGTSWSEVTNKNILMGVQPGMPPKGSFADIHQGRLFVGGDPQKMGILSFSNMTHLDWSTPNGGGWIGVIDDDNNNFPVGGIIEQYNDLWIFGRRAQPYIAKLSGASPDQYVITRTMQKGWTTSKVLMSSINDIWFSSADGANHLTGVQQYGDVRFHQASDPVRDRFLKWDPENTIAGVNPYTGQYMVTFPESWRTLVCHTKYPRQMPGGNIRYPWVEYIFTMALLTDHNQLKWTESSVPHEWYVTDVDGSNPNIPDPEFLISYSREIPRETVGSLVEFTYGYGDNDGLGFNTVYFCSGQDNMIANSENFAGWVQTNVTVTPDNGESPFRDMTADLLNFSGMSNANVYNSCSQGLNANDEMTFSVYLRLDSGSVVADDDLRISISGDLEQAVVLSIGEEISSEWKRFELTGITNDMPGTVTVGIICDALVGIEAFGAKLEDSSSATPYVGNPISIETEIRQVANPSSYADYDGKFFIGSSNGHIYLFNDQLYKELDLWQLYVDVKSPYIQIPFTHGNLSEFQLDMMSITGGSLQAFIYKDYRVMSHVLAFGLPAQDDLIVDDLSRVFVDDALMLVDPGENPAYAWLHRFININARAFQVRLTNFKLTGYPIYISGLKMKIRMLER